MWSHSKRSSVRYRIDGLCQEKLRLPAQVTNSLVTRLKIMCNLDISERRLPRMRIVFKKYTKKNIDIDLRVATGPMNFGEKCHAYSRQAEEHAAAHRPRFLRGELAGTANASASRTA